MNQQASVVSLISQLIPAQATLAPDFQAGLPGAIAPYGTCSIRDKGAPWRGSLQTLTAKLPIHQVASESDVHDLYQHLRQAALGYDAEALNDLGWMWVTGTHLKRNSALGLQVLQLAVEQNSAEAVFNQAEHLSHRSRDTEDLSNVISAYVEAFRCARNNALRGLIANTLAELHEHCIVGGKPDHDEAIAWYRVANECGDPWAVVNICILMLNSDSPAFNYERAFHELQCAALHGNRAATDYLIELYDGDWWGPLPPDDAYGRMKAFWINLAREQKLADLKACESKT